MAAEHIFFYGAGINDAVSTQRITDWFRSYGFQGRINVAEDLIAAARACFGDDTGIVCILGTGSNSCVYEKGKVIDSVPTLGYIFNDEGGGTQIGKEVLKAYFCKTMPEAERNIFEANYPITKEEVVEKVYRILRSQQIRC
jgi:glucosamine kinase